MVTFSREIFARAVDAAMTAYREAGHDIYGVPEPLRTLAVLQLSIDVVSDGGFELLFGREYPGSPPFEVFAEAWRRVGGTECAEIIECAIARFPTPEPHLATIEERRRWIDGIEEMSRLGDDFSDAAMRSVEPVFAFIQAHRDDFAIE